MVRSLVRPPFLFPAFILSSIRTPAQSVRMFRHFSYKQRIPLMYLHLRIRRSCVREAPSVRRLPLDPWVSLQIFWI